MMKPLTGQEVAREEALLALELPELVARDRRRAEAHAAQTLSGQLRRAIQDAGLTLEEAATVAGVSPREYADWSTGDAALSSVAMDRLVAAVHHQLTPVAP